MKNAIPVGSPIKSSRGYSLIELMVSILILTILAAVATPSMQNYMLRQQTTTFTQEFVESMVLARSEAITNATPFTIKANAGGWDEGWTFEFLDRDNVVKTYRSYRPNAGSLTINSIDGDDDLAFDDNGRLVTNAGAGALVQSRFQIGLADAVGANQSNCVTVMGSGNINISEGNCG